MLIDKKEEKITEQDASMIGHDMRITGKLISTGAVICAGELDGTVECESLHILPGAKFNGEIMATHVVIDGLVVGKVKAKNVRLSENADFNGDLCCAGIVIDEGAKIEANFRKDLVQNGKHDRQ